MRTVKQLNKIVIYTNLYFKTCHARSGVTRTPNNVREWVWRRPKARLPPPFARGAKISVFEPVGDDVDESREWRPASLQLLFTETNLSKSTVKELKTARVLSYQRTQLSDDVKDCEADLEDNYVDLLLSPSGDLGISLVWHNLSPPDPTPQLFGPTVEILFKLN